MDVLERRQLIAQSIRGFEEQIARLAPRARESAKDEGEKAEHRLEEESRLREVAALNQELCKAKTALGFIDRGWDGRCIEKDCESEDREISEARIKAIPYALRCKGCAENMRIEVPGYQGPERRRGRTLASRW